MLTTKVAILVGFPHECLSGLMLSFARNRQKPLSLCPQNQLDTPMKIAYSDEEKGEYEQSLKQYRDRKSALDTAYDEGKEEGRMEGKIEIAKMMKLEGESVEKIMRLTGLGRDEIERL